MALAAEVDENGRRAHFQPRYRSRYRSPPDDPAAPILAASPHPVAAASTGGATGMARAHVPGESYKVGARLASSSQERSPMHGQRPDVSRSASFWGASPRPQQGAAPISSRPIPGVLAPTVRSVLGSRRPAARSSAAARSGSTVRPTSADAGGGPPPVRSSLAAHDR